MESFLSRVTGKSFPGVYWSPFDELFIFGFRKEQFEFWRQNLSARIQLARIQTHHNKSEKVVKTVCDIKKSQKSHKIAISILNIQEIQMSL